MFKLLNLLCLLIIFIAISTGKKERKLPSGTVEKLRGRILKENPENVAVKNQLFQDIFQERLIGDKLQFGHVYENPIGWEQRFEEKDFLENRHRGKVKWADIDGSYGEHYWDINHA